MPPIIQIDRLAGTAGKAAIKGLGSLVGEVSTWTLTARKKDDVSDGTFDLRAVFAFLVPNLLIDPDYNEDRTLDLVLGKTRIVRVRLDNPARMALQGKVLFMEGVTFEWLRL
jgi:hypothetical protein